MLKMDFSSIDDIENILFDFKVLFAYNSNKIENSEIKYYDTREVFENDKAVGFVGNPRTLFEIQNQKKCYYYLLDNIIKRRIIDEDLLLEVHRLLTEGTYDEVRYKKGERPGTYKIGDYIVGKDEIGSQAKNVKKEIQSLLDEINTSNSDDYLTIGAYFHLVLETIHPFADGNGRVGRTLLNYYFMIHNIKPLIIYDEDKNLYYECLRAFDEKNDIEPFKKFLEYEQEKTWSKKQSKKIKLTSFL